MKEKLNTIFITIGMIFLCCSVVGAPQGNSAVVTNHQLINEVFFTDQNNRNDCGCENQETITYPVTPLYRTGLLSGGPAGPKKMIFTGVTPSSWDWRNAAYNGITGDWTTGIRNQGNCGSCYAFGAIAALESMINIARKNPNVDVDLSEQFIVSCGREWSGGFFGCNGGYFTSTFTFVETYGAIPEICFPYTSGESGYVPPCSQKCRNWQDLVLNIDNWASVASDIDSMKNALVTYGPLTVTLIVYNDFKYYSGGVYEHLGNDPGPTNHIVAIVGYDDSNNCWICKNSWGTAWGENGWFRIAYGDCNIGEDTATFTVTNTNHPPVVSGIPDQTIDEESTFATINLDDYVIDIDNTDAEMTWTYSGNSQLTVNIMNRVATIGILNPDWNGAETITFRATDPGSLWDDDAATFAVAPKGNQPPNPPTIIGPAIGNVSTAYDYNFTALDPDGDEVYYLIDWGDNNNSSWIGPYSSGDQIIKSHTWSTKGTYMVKAKAKDPFGNESDWATLTISMPYNKILNTPLMQSLQNFIQNYPNLFPILQKIIQHLGLQ